jgi:hypothetical protein
MDWQQFRSALLSVYYIIAEAISRRNLIYTK